eukprot:m.233703 g.233703  ORF g.233703 m.233703 type:complete len:272 (+) comp19280_c0_seq1:2387-3202(+)
MKTARLAFTAILPDWFSNMAVFVRCGSVFRTQNTLLSCVRSYNGSNKDNKDNNKPYKRYDQRKREFNPSNGAPAGHSSSDASPGAAPVTQQSPNLTTDLLELQNLLSGSSQSKPIFTKPVPVVQAPAATPKPPRARPKGREFSFASFAPLGLFPVTPVPALTPAQLVDKLLTERTISRELASPLEKLDITRSVVPIREPSAEEVIAAHSDFSDIVASMNVESEVGQYFINVVTPRLSRLPFIAPEKKRELVRSLVSQLKEVENRPPAEENA